MELNIWQKFIKKYSSFSYFCLRGAWHRAVSLEDQAVRPWWSLHRRRGSAGGEGWPDGSDPVRGLDRTAGGVRVGGLDQLHRAGLSGRGCWTARGGLVAGGSSPESWLRLSRGPGGGSGRGGGSSKILDCCRCRLSLFYFFTKEQKSMQC